MFVFAIANYGLWMAQSNAMKQKQTNCSSETYGTLYMEQELKKHLKDWDKIKPEDLE